MKSMINKIILVMAVLFVASTSYAAEHIMLVDGENEELGTASNPVYVSGGTTGAGVGWEESGDGIAFDTDYDFLLIDKETTITDTLNVDSLNVTSGSGNVFGGTNEFSAVNASRVAVFNASKQLTDSTVTSSTLSYLDIGSSLTNLLAGKQGTLTNSTGLAGALSDETGTGLSVFNTAPQFTGNASFVTLTTSGTATIGGTTTVNGNTLDFTTDATGNPSQLGNWLGDLSVSRNLTVIGTIKNSAGYNYAQLSTFLTLSTNQTLTASGNNIAWAAPAVLNDITYNTTTHQLSLSGNNTYMLTGYVACNGQGATTAGTFRWYDVTNSIYIAPGVKGVSVPQAYASNNATSDTAVAVYTPAANCNVELRIFASSAISAFESSASYAYVTTIKRKV
jgi:hypothetical protein